MTARQVALIRGVNNVGSRRVAMADLRALFEDLGFRDVRTLLNSGNIVFSVPNDRRGDLLAGIEKALAARLGLTSVVILLSGGEVAAVVRDNPFSKVANDPSRLLVMVPRKPSDQRRLKPLLEEPWAPERLALGRRVAYLWCANGVAKSPLWAAVDRSLKRCGTVRNMATMTKLLTLVEGRSS
jgi:uncharacterized protein (DUF1697 family)